VFTLRAVVVACVLFWVARADAATVALFRPASDAPALDEALYRLQGELLAVGLNVAILDRPPFRDTSSPEARAWLEQASTERDIDAFIDVVGRQTPLAVEVWVYERSPARLRHTRVALEPDASNAAATLAIRAIEVLRSSFLVLDSPGEQRPPAAPTAPPPPAPAPQRERLLFGIEAGATALTGFDGVAPALLPLARFGWAFSPAFALQATGAAFGTRPQLDTPAGSVEVAQQFALLGLCACRASGEGIRPLAAVAFGALHTALDGQASSPNFGHRVDRWSLLLDLGVGARLSLEERLYLSLASHLQVATPYVAVHSVDTVVATTGRPNLLFTFTAGARL
jgi:hypothetical protein